MEQVPLMEPATNVAGSDFCKTKKKNGQDAIDSDPPRARDGCSTHRISGKKTYLLGHLAELTLAERGVIAQTARSYDRQDGPNGQGKESPEKRT